MLLTVLFLMLSIQPAPSSTFEVALWPGEGRPVFGAAVARLELRERPSAAAGVVSTWTGRLGEHLAFDDTLYRTVKPGRFVALGPATISGRQLGERKHLSREDYYSGTYGTTRVDVAVNEVVEYLQYRAEGTCFVRVAGRVVDADPCPTEQPNSYRLDAKPETEWWIHIANGNAKGWLLVKDATVRIIRREW